ncbi:MAG TPA: MFS transporter [Jatrophihabitans sp.]|nr:MFS transporter [Jatrophihabitans sp.]
MTAAEGPVPPGAGGPAGPGSDGFSAPTYHAGRGAAAEPAERQRSLRTPPAGTGGVTVTRAVLARSRYFSRLLAHKVITASEADGAKESGLTALIWNQVMSYGADAMVTVALAGTVFFSAPSNAQRGNVLLYLLMTMAPFAVVAPVIGPALDRVQHGRRWVMAGTALGRAVLAATMAVNFTDLYVLFPAALGSLVLSKAYSVIRSAAAPRLVPSGLTLVEANARLSLFGLVAAILGGGLAGAVIKATGSYPLGLWLTAIAFATTAIYSLRLPKIVDALPPVTLPQRAAEPPGRTPATRPDAIGHRGVPGRLLAWARRGFAPEVIGALQGESSLRWLSGFLTLFLAFYIESTAHGWHAVVSLGAVGAAAGLGNFCGTGIGTRLRLARPELIILCCTSAAAVGCLLAALLFSLPVAVCAMFVSAVCNALSKLSLDAIIQKDVAESLRSSAFGRSETFLQLAWVFGATVALLLPSGQGQLGFAVAAAVLCGVAVLMLAKRRSRSSQRRAAADRA